MVAPRYEYDLPVLKNNNLLTRCAPLGKILSLQVFLVSSYSTRSFCLSIILKLAKIKTRKN